MGYAAQQLGIYTTYVPVITGFTTTPTINNARYTLVGKMCTVDIRLSATASNATTKTITLPFAAYGGAVTRVQGWVFNNGASTTGVLRIDTSAGSAVATLYRDGTGLAWTASGTADYAFSITYEIQ